MSEEPRPELRRLAATLFAAGRAERPGPGLGRRLSLIEPQSAVQRAPAPQHTASERRVARSLWLAAALLAGGAGLWFAAESEAPLRISPERESRSGSSTSGERAEVAAPTAQLETPPAASAAEAAARDEGAAHPAATRRPGPPARHSPVQTERSTPPSATAPAVAAPAAAPLTLLAELDLLKRARAALRSGDGAQALELLDRHARERGSNGLEAEATLLRIETLAALGKPGEASELATRFVRANPNNALGDRARSFIRRLPAKAP